MVEAKERAYNASRYAYQPHDVPRKPENQFKDEADMVLVKFDRRVLLTLDSFEQVEFLPGLVSIPRTLLEHPYLQAHKVVEYKEPIPPVSKLPEMNDLHLLFMRSVQGYAVKDLETAQKFFANLSSDQRVNFLMDFSDWVQKNKSLLTDAKSPAEQVLQQGSADIQKTQEQETGKQKQAGGKKKKNGDDKVSAQGSEEGATDSTQQTS